jgi:proteasome lid subunit RPN8/RPN11
MIQINIKHVEEIRQHAEQDYPYTCCGLLAGYRTTEGHKVVLEIYRLANLNYGKQSGYEVSGEVLFTAQRDIYKKKLNLVGIYHSHLDRPAIIDSTDINLGYYKSASYIIVSVYEGRVIDLRSWDVDADEQQASEEKIVYKPEGAFAPMPIDSTPFVPDIGALRLKFDQPITESNAKNQVISIARRLRIFLCHASADKPAVRDLHDQLQKEGFDPWLDEENLLAGQDWDQEITKAVRKSDIVIICLSQTSITKAGYIQKEIRFALDVADEQPEGTIFLIPLKLEECEVPGRLSKWQWVKLFEEKGYEQLVKALKHRATTLDT